MDRLLKELQGITRALELSNTTPSPAEDLQVQADLIEKYPYCLTVEESRISEIRKEPTRVRCNKRWQMEHLYRYAERPKQVTQTSRRLIYGVP